MQKIENEYLKVVIDEKGGQLKSLWRKENSTEYLWQGDSAIWADRAPNLFPYIARLTKGCYRYRGNIYHMDIHGFLKDSELLPCGDMLSREASLTLYMTDNESTRAQYPFTFRLEITYQLNGRSLEITYCVENRGNEPMYFGIGGHPGFCVPVGGKGAFEDYYVAFEEGTAPLRVGMSEDCFATGEDLPFRLEKGFSLPLRHEMFDEDAIILKNAGHSVRLASDRHEGGVSLTFPRMDYLGIWHRPGTRASYVCLEPWTSLPSRKGVIEDLEKQDNLVTLPGGEIYRNTYTISVY